MSVPTIPDMNPDINITREDAINLLLASIGQEEMALAEIIKAESLKLKELYRSTCDPCKIIEVHKSIASLLKVVSTQETILQMKLRDVLELQEDKKCDVCSKGFGCSEKEEMPYVKPEFYSNDKPCWYSDQIDDFYGYKRQKKYSNQCTNKNEKSPRTSNEYDNVMVYTVKK